MITIAPPPALLLPEHFNGRTPAIIRPDVDPLRYFPVRLSHDEWRAALADLEVKKRVDWRAFAPGTVAVIANRVSGTPTLVSSNGYTSGGVTVNPVPVPLPAGITSGKKLIVLLGQPGQAVVTTPGGWSLLGTYGGTGSLDRKLYVFQRPSDGSEGSTLNITLDTARLAAAVSAQISGSSSTTLITGTNGTSVDVDPPVNNPGTSAATLWMAGASKRQTGALTAPSGYTMVDSARVSSNISVAAAIKTSTAVSEDPGVFVGSGSDVWAAATLGFRA